MLRNEDRLYHIVVSFPSICANQFLILKFRRNEAICCLIGFSIGIGCCLMYRWIRNTFFSLEFRSSYEKVTANGEDINDASTLAKLKNKLSGASHFYRSSSNSRDDRNSNSNLLFDTSWHYQTDCFYNKKPSGKIRTNSAKHSRDSYWSRASSKQRSFDYYSSSNNTSKSQSQSRYSSSYNLNYDHIGGCNYFNDPLNDVYQNLAKFLNKQFCKSFKLRNRASLNKKYYNKSSNYFDFFNNKTTNLNNNNNNSYASFSSVKPQSNHPLSKNTSIQNSLDTSINLANNLNSSKKDDENKNFDDKASIKSNNSIVFYEDYDLLTQTNPGEDIILKEKMINFDGASPSFDSNNNNNNNYSNSNNNLNQKFENDNISIDSFMDDTLNDSTKLLFPTETVDKSLDEALHHIDMLKEDMNHLCKDIDTLYNNKGSGNTNNNHKTSLLNDYSSSQMSLNKILNKQHDYLSDTNFVLDNDKNNDDQIRETIDKYKLSLESNQFKKCSCIYSDIIEFFKQDVNKDSCNSDEIIYYDDKYAQTNIDNFLSTSMSTSTTSTSISFSRFRNHRNNKNLNSNFIISNKFSRRRYFLTNKYNKKPNGLYVLSTSPSMTNTSSSLNYCSLAQKKRLPKRSKQMHR